MKLDVKVKNLGKIKEADFHIRPMTVITGPNGTGKSFFTKSLYSILNVINKNIYHEYVIQKIDEIESLLELFFRTITKLHENREIPAHINTGDKGSSQDLEIKLNKLKDEFVAINNYKTSDYCFFAASKVDVVEGIRESYNSYLYDLRNMYDVGFDKLAAEEINTYFNNFIFQLGNIAHHYSDFFTDDIKNELKDNFQIPMLSELISFGEKKIEIEINKLSKIELNDCQVILNLNSDVIYAISDLPSVVFFESPAYWKVRDALKSAKNNQNRPRLPKNNNDILTGVPKYFYDLDNVLNIRTKTEGVFKSATDLLKSTLGGEFVFKDDNFTFIDNDRREISKHLVSFGMTNLGMIQALLKYNVITEGSFIFIDEPETNLHPDWQVKLVEVLLMLAKGGVNVVITTHSSDLMKALEVKIKKQQIDVMEDFLSVHFVDVDGKLLEFESEDKLQQLIEARNLLSLAYQQLYFSDL
ncbi:AAA family ATPase [Crenothrix polyspora]|uniref:Endonuclease GajA/Old nuclease/RecF-like AAA domain-containing protein n=1 Tax=Crenothrix polyspora TaxID=360316 RepID=A0A1R4HJH9_9GAMM|nr:AAA family ATPase [Crenothrix polyspora]SJM96388.1 conserved hypothetical protein [Crenothrix polyspora]